MKTYLYHQIEFLGEKTWEQVSELPIRRIEFEFDHETQKPMFHLHLDSIKADEQFAKECNNAGLTAYATNYVGLYATEEICFQDSEYDNEESN